MPLDMLSLLVCCMFAYAGACFALAVIAHVTLPGPETARRLRVKSSDCAAQTQSPEGSSKLQKALEDLEAEKKQVRVLNDQLRKERKKQEDNTNSQKILEDLEAGNKEVNWLKDQLRVWYKKQEGWTEERMRLVGLILSMSSVIAACSRDAFASGKRIKMLEAAVAVARDDDDQESSEEVARLQRRIAEQQDTINDHIRDADNSQAMRDNLQQTVNHDGQELAFARNEAGDLGEIIASYAEDAFTSNSFEKKLRDIVELYGIDEMLWLQECEQRDVALYGLDMQCKQFGQKCLMQHNSIQQLSARLARYEDRLGRPLQTPGRDPRSAQAKGQESHGQPGRQDSEELQNDLAKLQEKLRSTEEELKEAKEAAEEYQEGLEEAIEEAHKSSEKLQVRGKQVTDLNRRLQEMQRSLRSSAAAAAFWRAGFRSQVQRSTIVNVQGEDVVDAQHSLQQTPLSASTSP